MCGALKRARLVRVGVAEVVFVRKEDAVSAYRKYNNRCLDGEFYRQGHKINRALWVSRALGCVLVRVLNGVVPLRAKIFFIMKNF